MTSCPLSKSYQRFGESYCLQFQGQDIQVEYYPSWTTDPDDGGTKLLRNIANYLPFERAQQHRHLELKQHCCENRRYRRVGVHCITGEHYHSVGKHLSGQPHYPEYHKLSFHHHETLKFHVYFPCRTSRWHYIMYKLQTTK